MAFAAALDFARRNSLEAGKGAEKLDYVIAELEKRGFTADRAEIEAAVAEQFNIVTITTEETEEETDK